MSTINLVKYFFYKEMLPTDQVYLRNIIALAYQTARDRKLYPEAVLIRSSIHKTTSIGGVHRKDAKGWHVTISFKDSDQLCSGTHVSCHGYVKGKNSFDFVEATHAGEKADCTTKLKGGVVWPSEDKLDLAPEIGYGHFPEHSGLDEPVFASIQRPGRHHQPLASWTTGSTSYSATSSTLSLLPEETPFVSVILKHGTYRFQHNGKEIRSTASDWKDTSIMCDDGEVRFCIAYTGKKSRKIWFTWELPTS